MSDLNDERVGQASFELRREAAVERSLAKVRHHLGRDWATLTSREVESLGWLLGELWMNMGFAAWETVGFDSITLETIDRLVGLAGDIRTGLLNQAVGLSKAREALGRVGQANEEK